MEEEEQRIRETHLPYSPWFTFCAKFLMACLRCLGYEPTTEQPPYPTSEEERAKKVKEVVAEQSTRSITVLRRPPRPPPTRGRGGQINKHISTSFSRNK